MNYKALEDLINILVRKCGTELNADIAKKEIVILENRLKKVRSDIESLREYISIMIINILLNMKKKILI